MGGGWRGNQAAVTLDRSFGSPRLRWGRGAPGDRAPAQKPTESAVAGGQDGGRAPARLEDGHVRHCHPDKGVRDERLFNHRSQMGKTRCRDQDGVPLLAWGWADVIGTFDVFDLLLRRSAAPSPFAPNPDGSFRMNSAQQVW